MCRRESHLVFRCKVYIWIVYIATHPTWMDNLLHLQGGWDPRSCSLPLLCLFWQLHLTMGIVIYVNDIELLGKNIPCISLIQLLFSQIRWILLLYYRNKNYCCLDVLQESWVGKKNVGLASTLRMSKIFKQQKLMIIKFLCPWYSSTIISLRPLRSSS